VNKEKLNVIFIVFKDIHVEKNKNNTFFVYQGVKRGDAMAWDKLHKCSVVFIGGTFTIILLSACSEERISKQANSIDTIQEQENSIYADWDEASKSLHISGTADARKSRVEITTAGTNKQLGRTNIRNNGQWSIEIENVNDPPCSVVVNIDDNTQKVNIFPDLACTKVSGIQARANKAPEAHILQPATDIVINVGQKVMFQGHGVDPDQMTPLNFNWDFAGQAVDFNGEVPGEVQFKQAGEFRVRMDAMDDQGASDATPPIRIIRVQDPNNRSPDAVILEPAGDVTINPGDSLMFRGEAVDSEGNVPLSIDWDFAGQAQAKGLNPGNVQFNAEGVFIVEMRVNDSLGAQDPTPDRRAINVVNPANANQPPDSIIIEPVVDREIAIGERIRFRGQGNDPDGNNPLTFEWDFNNGTRKRFIQNPGVIQFNQAGKFQIRMRAMDAFGEIDPTPATRTIIVGNPQINPNQPPQSKIVEPVADTIIAIGDKVRFIGAGNDPEGDSPLNFQWDFDQVAPGSNALDAGEITFNQPGVYRIKFTAMDNLNNIDQTPDERIISVIDNNVTPQNLAPESHILLPIDNQVITVGDAIRFEGHGNDPDENNPLTFNWNFDGALTNDNVQNPGDMVFERAGVYTVRMTVTDNVGRPDLTPATRTITVLDNNNLAPNATIIEPQNDMVINVGDNINFIGRGEDPDQNGPLSFQWQFDGEAPNSSQQDTGNIQFNNAGQFHIRLRVQDTHGLGDPTPDERLIIVQ